MGHVKKLIVLFCIFFLYACDTDASGVHHINNTLLTELMQKNVPVIDVRTTTEWKKTGIVEGSHLLMFYDEKGKYDLNKWLTDVAAIAGKDEPVILICHSGGRSKDLANYLVQEAGYKTVYNVKRGIQYWIKKRNRVVTFQ